jgi:uncharacterized protein (TIGR00251 family)
MDDNMIVNVRVVPNAKKRRIQLMPDGSLKAWVMAPAENGRANAALLEALSAEFSCGAWLVSGAKSRQKVVEMDVHFADGKMHQKSSKARF